jgi:hypothetical protein
MPETSAMPEFMVPPPPVVRRCCRDKCVLSGSSHHLRGRNYAAHARGDGTRSRSRAAFLLSPADTEWNDSALPAGDEQLPL